MKMNLYQEIKLEDISKQSKKGASHLSQRIDEIINVFQIYKELFPKLNNKLNKRE